MYVCSVLLLMGWFRLAMLVSHVQHLFTWVAISSPTEWCSCICIRKSVFYQIGVRRTVACYIATTVLVHG
jgi:hypothetical protein